MNYHHTARKAWRVYIWQGGIIYYANRHASKPLPYVQWRKKGEEYPDHFDAAQISMLRHFHVDRVLHMEEVWLSKED